MVGALRIVDEVVTYQSLCDEELAALDFDIFALGEDQVSDRFDAMADWCRTHGKKVVRLKRTPGICSSQI